MNGKTNEDEKTTIVLVLIGYEWVNEVLHKINRKTCPFDWEMFSNFLFSYFFVCVLLLLFRITSSASIGTESTCMYAIVLSVKEWRRHDQRSDIHSHISMPFVVFAFNTVCAIHSGHLQFYIPGWERLRCWTLIPTLLAWCVPCVFGVRIYSLNHSLRWIRHKDDLNSKRSPNLHWDFFFIFLSLRLAF